MGLWTMMQSNEKTENKQNSDNIRKDRTTKRNFKGRLQCSWSKNYTKDPLLPLNLRLKQGMYVCMYFRGSLITNGIETIMV